MAGTQKNIDPILNHTLVDVINEVSSSPLIRQKLIQKFNEKTGRHAIVYVAAPIAHIAAYVNDWDAEIIENTLRSYGGKLKKVDLIIQSGGGFAESAERVINNIYSYCNDLRIIIPGQAKSAATIIAMGGSKILMSDTSEIGSIDPQMIVQGGNVTPAQSVIKAHAELMRVIAEKQSKKEAYDAELVMLSKIDPVFLRECQKYMDLAKDIASKLINRKMRAKNPISPDEIEKNFLDDSRTFSHGRLIGWEEAQKLGLEIEYVDKFDESWGLIWEIYIRTKIALEQGNLPKIIEDANYSLNPGSLTPIRQG